MCHSSLGRLPQLVDILFQPVPPALQKAFHPASWNVALASKFMDCLFLVLLIGLAMVRMVFLKYVQQSFSSLLGMGMVN